MIIKCVCGFETNSTTNIKLHRENCQIFKDELYHLNKEFFNHQLNENNQTLYSITTKILNNKFPFNIIIKKASEYGYKPLNASRATSKSMIDRKQTNLKKYGSEGGPGIKSFICCDGTVVKIEELENILNKEFFDEYVGRQNMLFTDITEQILKNKFSYPTIISYARKHGYNISDRSEANFKSQEKQKQTMLNLYGVDNCSKSEDIKEKKKETSLKNYGTEYPIQNENIKQLIKDNLINVYGVDNVSKIEDVKEKKKETSLKNYGVDNIFKKTDYIRSCFIEKYKNSSILYQPSNLNYSKSSQVFFQKLYDNLNNNIKQFVYFATLNKEYLLAVTDITYYYLDFSIITDNIKICIEYNGDMWHANPNQYKETDTPNPFYLDLTSKDIWLYDENRLNQIKSLGFDNLVVWQSDINKNFDQKIQDCLNFINSKFENNIYEAI